MTIVPQEIHSDARWVAISKPAGWLTIPGRPGVNDSSHDFPVLSEWVRSQYGPIWLVHRLDRDTSGTVLFARTEKDHAQANLWFRERKVRKVYWALAQGQAASPVLKIKSPVDGKPSTTQIEVLEAFSHAFLAAATPVTGRRHQIRVHLAEEGHSILGDIHYGGKVENKIQSGILAVNRVALHALTLDLPTGEKFRSPLPEDFESWLKALREEAL